VTDRTGHMGYTFSPFGEGVSLYPVATKVLFVQAQRSRKKGAFLAVRTTRSCDNRMRMREPTDRANLNE
jgi:hypothetical protein